MRVESDLDEGHRASGLCDASAQLVHAVLHGTQDFGLLRLWMTPFVSTGSGRGHGQERGDPGVASVHRWDREWPRCPPICQRCLEHRPVPFPNARGESRLAVRLPSLTSGQVQGLPRSLTSLNSLENFLQWARGREWGKGHTRGHSAVLGIPIPKDCVPSPGLKMGILGKSPGSCESPLQAGETENPKAEAPRPGWKPKETGGGGSGTNHRTCSHHGPGAAGQSGLCAGPRTDVACHTHLNPLPQPWANQSWDWHEPGPEHQPRCGYQSPRTPAPSSHPPARPSGPFRVLTR